MSGKDYYDILNVPRNADEKELKRAYRSLTKKFHPDINKEEGAEEKFKDINEAYDVLSDRQKRAQYDQMGHDTYTSASKGSYQGGGYGSSGFNADFGGFGDIFDSFFGGGSRGPRGPQRGSDLLMRIQISLRDAVFGVDRDIDVMHNEPCTDCGGTGSATKKTNVCPRCGGSGQERRANNTPFGQFVSMVTCSQCSGSGRIPEERCKTCNGSGHSRVKRTITVNIPAGVDSGNRLRMEGYGEAGDAGAPNGDLYIEMHVVAHPQFSRIGDNLETSADITPAQATLGSMITIESIDGRKIDVKVPAGVQYNTALKISGEGVRRRGRPGDLLVRIKIAIPKRLNAQEKELYEKILELEGKKESGAGSKGFFKDLKDKMK
ncbi:MAG: molecular chaperone DnaJ, partial [Methanogenium sp.]